MIEPAQPPLLTDDEIQALLKERIDTHRLSVGISIGITDRGLLGHILGLRAGTDYEALIKSRICTPLGMTNTSIALSLAMEKALATGHDDSLDPVPNWDLGVLAGAGGLRSNVFDLLNFLETFGAPSSPLAAAIGPFSAPVESGGLGRLRPTPSGYALMHHEGHTGGHNAYVEYVPAWQRGIVVLANAYPASASALGRHLMDQRYGDQWFRREAEVDPNQFDRLIGTYGLRPHFDLSVPREGDRLFAQATGQRRIRVFPASTWHYFYKAVGAQLTFEPGLDGRAARVILHQNSRDQIAARID